VIGPIAMVSVDFPIISCAPTATTVAVRATTMRTGNEGNLFI